MKTILFIDNSERHRFLLQEGLRAEGYRVITAKNTEEALTEYQKFTPDLIILGAGAEG